jgi:hypothetical protein
MWSTFYVAFSSTESDSSSKMPPSGYFMSYRTPACNNQPNKGMIRSDMSKPALIFFSLQEYTQQNTLSKF